VVYGHISLFSGIKNRLKLAEQSQKPDSEGFTSSIHKTQPDKPGVKSIGVAIEGNNADHPINKVIMLIHSFRLCY
jgi:hypothetical protein